MTIIAVGLGAVALNTAFWFLMLGIQLWEARNSRIPPRTRKFLYLQDFNTNGWGDLTGLVLIDVAVAVELASKGASLSYVLGFLVLGAVVATLFYKACTAATHKPDAGYLEGGRITLVGRVHLVYFGLQVATAGLGMYFLATDRQPILLLGFAGALLYVWAVVRDITTGNFAKIRG